MKISLFQKGQHPAASPHRGEEKGGSDCLRCFRFRHMVGNGGGGWGGGGKRAVCSRDWQDTLSAQASGPQAGILKAPDF